MFPAVHLTLVDLLRAVIETGGVTKPHRIGGGEQSERRVRPDDLVLIEQREPPIRFEDSLNDEHDVRPPGVVFVKHQSGRRLQRPRQQTFAKFGDLLALAQHDGVLADQIDTADVAVEIDTQAWPVEPRRHLFDVCRLAGAVVALDQDFAVVLEAGKDRQCRIVVKAIGFVKVGHVVPGLRKRRHLYVAVNAKDLING